MSGCPRCGGPLTRVSGLRACADCGPLANAHWPGLKGDEVSEGGSSYRRVPDLHREERGSIKPDLGLDSPYRKAW